MRAIINILFCCIFLSYCKAQDTEFKMYLNNFGQRGTPLLVNDRQSSSAVFCQAYDTLLRVKTIKPIQENIVAKYICTNGFCNPDGGYFRYDYGVKVDLSSDFILVVVSKLQYEGDSEWDFDLGETILITYNNKGGILSRLSLAKDNDRWKSSLKIAKERVTVRQIKITEPKIDQYHRDLRCEYWTTTYQITTDGIIKPIDKSSVSTGIVIWDKINEEYILKE
ncbi:hypothetical protein [Macellibacteroides fermentans]|uniref:Uncharacterized protein n=1 Tax=Parabacteroides chartae TaxID=1037355 RepID=A0A1T5D6N2_9BACT|nr:hypothetical protein [Parabacteroides chartae]SKB67251.1 hypothetical protein SAMN05660349_02293 [Parabacteroides chartae]